MEESKSLNQRKEIPEKKFIKETLEINNNELESKANLDEVNNNIDSKINLIDNPIDKGNNKIVEEKKLDEDKKVELTSNLKANIDVSKKNIENSNNKIIDEKRSENNSLAVAEIKSDTVNKSAEDTNISNKGVTSEINLEKNKKVISTVKANLNADKTKNNPKEISTTIPVKAKTKPVKEPPIEKKPFLEFVNDYLIPEIKNQFKLKGKEVNKINLQKTQRPIAEDICWVIYCEVNDTCNFWLSFQKEDITSLKSFSLCKNYEKPSIIESFLIDEKKITLKLIISRILQRLNGQKLIGAN